MVKTCDAYIGWFRPSPATGRHPPWRMVCRAATQDECETLLLAYQEVGVQRADKVVLARGRVPWGRVAWR